MMFSIFGNTYKTSERQLNEEQSQRTKSEIANEIYEGFRSVVLVLRQYISPSVRYEQKLI